MRPHVPALKNACAAKVFAYITAYRNPAGGPPSQEEIAIHCSMTKGYVSRLVNRLANEGHLVKQGRNWYGADIPNRAEIEEAERLERSRMRMLNGDARLRGGK